MVRYRDLLSDTILAPITPPGFSGVSVLRVSGEKSLEITKRLCNLEKKELLSHTCRLAKLKNTEDQVIDQVLLTFFEKGRSFTGDKTVEISCHGNPMIVNQIAELYLNQGCRSAEKGEFSFRAFYNGNIDLVQAESIHEVVTSRSGASSRSFLSQLEGRLSSVFNELEQELISSIAHLEATIDFVEQDIEPEENRMILKKLEIVQSKVSDLLNSYDTGKSLREGFRILLLGETNVGKSSLFNWLIEKDRSIVTDVAGTTRDIVSDQTFVGHHGVEFFDSAGLRMSDDKVENIGIQKTLDKASEADLVLVVVDAQNPSKSFELIDQSIENSLFVFNKTDLVEKADEVLTNYNKNNSLSVSPEKCCFTSVVANTGKQELLNKIEQKITGSLADQAGEVITHARHFEHLKSLSDYLEKAVSLLKTNESPDLVSQELVFGLSEVHSILGKQYDDEVLDKIFGDFCIGK